MKVKTEVQASFSFFSNTCLPALLPMPCTHPVELGLRFLITSINLKLRLLSLAGLHEVRFPQFRGNLRTACAWLLSPKRSTLKLGLPGIVSSIRCKGHFGGGGCQGGQMFSQLLWVPPLGAAAVLGPIAAQVVNFCPRGLSVTVVGWPGFSRLPWECGQPLISASALYLWVEVMRMELGQGRKKMFETDLLPRSGGPWEVGRLRQG